MKQREQSRPIRVLLAEDHVVVREGLAALLACQPDMEVVGQATNGREAIERFRELRPDVLLADLRMPEMGGVEVIAAVRAEFPDARVIVLTTFDGDEDVYRALEAGAQGYLLKDADTSDLLQAIRAVHEGRRFVPAAVAQRLVERTLAGPALTQRELQVLKLVAVGKTNKEVASALFITEGTVKTHVNNILEKLGVRDRTEAAMTALRRGILHL
jgi:two-component system NarL family response regulator